jgi:HEAT repeat protein
MVGHIQDETVTTELRGLPIDEGVRRLLRNTNSVFIYSARPSSASMTLDEVHVYPIVHIGTRGMATSTTPGTAEATDARAFELLAADSRARRKAAAQALGRTADATAIALLGQALSQEDGPSVREEIVKALGRTRSETAVGPLSAALRSDADPHVREAAAAALGKTWSELAVEPLAAALLGDPRASVREASARALGTTWAEAAVKPLARALLDDPRWYVRERAVYALGRIGSPGAAASLATALRDRDSSVSETAGAVLATMQSDP